MKGARYGLWLYKPNGNDVYLGNKTSGEDGWTTFEDVPTPALAEDAANPKNVTRAMPRQTLSSSRLPRTTKSRERERADCHHGGDHAQAQDKDTLVLFDQRTPEYRQEIRNKPESDEHRSGLAQTGDLFNPVSTLAIALVDGGLVILGLRATRPKRSAQPDRPDHSDQA